MAQEIQLIIADDKLKVYTPYNAKFVEKARNLRGSWKSIYWEFDDSVIDYVREALLEIYGTTGEKPYENCTLIIKDFSSSKYHGPVELFGRGVARAFGRDSGAKLLEGIVFISGSYNSGGSVKNWSTVVSNATFEMQNFPLPQTETKEVQDAISEGWCTIKKSTKQEVKKISWNDADVYRIIGPYAMNPSVLKEMDSNLTTTDKMEWLLYYVGSELKAFCSVEKSNISMTLKNFYAVDKDDSHKFYFLKSVMDDFQKSDFNKLHCFFKTEQLVEASNLGFKEIGEGKNWHRMVIVK